MEMIDRVKSRQKTKKGDYAEEITIYHLGLKNIRTMINAEEGPHPFDFFIYNKTSGNWEFQMSDVKAKTKMAKYNGTGIDEKDYNEYVYLSEKYNMEFYLFFVDEDAGKCYGNTIKNLSKKVIEDNVEYPFIIKANGFVFTENVIIFHMSNMIDEFELSADEIKIMKSYSKSKYLSEEAKQKRLKEISIMRKNALPIQN